jgi:hypothetical protein
MACWSVPPRQAPALKKVLAPTVQGHDRKPVAWSMAVLLNSLSDAVVYIPRAERVSFDMMVRYRIEKLRGSVLLRNLSSGGARVEGLAGLRMGDKLFLYLPSLKPKEANVVWSVGELVGLEFERPLHPDVYEDLVLHHARRRERTDADRALHIDGRYNAAAPVSNFAAPQPWGNA